jgi:hypothetical protein
VRGTDRDKAADALRDRKAERTKLETGVIDSYLVVAGVVAAIPTIGTVGPSDQDRCGKLDDLGSTTGRVATTGNGRRGGQLYFLKSHEMRHSNPICEFMRRGERLSLREAISGLKGSGLVLRALPTKACIQTDRDRYGPPALAEAVFNTDAFR